MRPLHRSLKFRRPPHVSLAPTVFRSDELVCDVVLVDRKSGTFFCRKHGCRGIGALKFTMHYLGVDEPAAREIVHEYRKAKAQ